MSIFNCFNLQSTVSAACSYDCKNTDAVNVYLTHEIRCNKCNSSHTCSVQKVHMDCMLNLDYKERCCWCDPKSRKICGKGSTCALHNQYNTCVHKLASEFRMSHCSQFCVYKVYTTSADMNNENIISDFCQLTCVCDVKNANNEVDNSAHIKKVVRELKKSEQIGIIQEEEDWENENEDENDNDKTDLI